VDQAVAELQPIVEQRVAKHRLLDLPPMLEVEAGVLAVVSKIHGVAVAAEEPAEMQSTLLRRYLQLLALVVLVELLI
jgi:hypothetical protein